MDGSYEVYEGQEEEGEKKQNNMFIVEKLVVGAHCDQDNP